MALVAIESIIISIETTIIMGIGERFDNSQLQLMAICAFLVWLTTVTQNFDIMKFNVKNVCLMFASIHAVLYGWAATNQYEKTNNLTW